MPEVAAPFEVSIEAVPVSLQTRNKANLRNWKARVALEARAVVGPNEQPIAGAVYATILYLPYAAMQGDVDNIVKPILDGLVGVAYVDDRQVQRVVVQKFEPGQVVIEVDTAKLANVVGGPTPVIYIRIDTENTKKDRMP